MNYHTLDRAICSMLLIVCLCSNSLAESRCVSIISPTAVCGSSFIEEQTSGQKAHFAEKKKKVEPSTTFFNTATVENTISYRFFTSSAITQHLINSVINATII